MKKVSKYLCMLLALAMLFALSACGSKEKTYANELEKIKGTGVLTVSMSPDFAPMEFTDPSKSGQEQYVGFDVSLAQYLADYFGVKLEIVPMAFEACSTAVSSGTVNMSISGYSWKEDRAENFELSDPYFAGDNETEQALLIRVEDADKYKDAADFAGVPVGAQNASLQQTLVEEQLPDSKLQIFGDIGVGVMELQQGNLEAIAVAKGNGKQIIANNPDLMLCEWEFEVAAEYENNVVMIAKGQTELLAAVNEALAKAYADGLYGPWYDEAVELGYALGAIE